MAEKLAEHIICNTRTGMAEMCVAIYGRATDIHAYMTRIDRSEKFFLTRKSIGKSEWSHHYISLTYEYTN